MSLTFLILILFILAIVVFLLAFREPLARYAAGNAGNHGVVNATNQPSASPSPIATPVVTGKKTIIVIDGGTTEPSASPSPTATASPSPSPRASGKPKASPSASPKPTHSPGDNPEDLKTVVLYFTRVSDDGHISIEKVNRSIKFTDNTPLLSSIRALLKGPSGSELSNGIVSMIPAGTALLSAYIENSIAFLNFSENFQFNPLGGDGMRAQVRQVVWVATEFPTVKGVQFLIEGKKVAYLGGDNVAVDKPLNRNNLP